MGNDDSVLTESQLRQARELDALLLALASAYPVGSRHRALLLDLSGAVSFAADTAALGEPPYSPPPQSACADDGLDLS